MSYVASDQDRPLLSGPGSSPLRLVHVLLVASTALVAGTLGVSIAGAVYANDARHNTIDIPPVPLPLPYRFAVDPAYILPPTNQANLGTCWCFATIYLLESQYRAQGIAAGLLEPDEVVTFSNQAWFTWLGEKCAADPSVKACHYGGLMQNSSEDQEIESFYYFNKAWPESARSVLPDAICPYRAEPADDPNWTHFWCPGLDDAIPQNPLNYRIKNLTMAYTVTAIKELIVSAGRALGIGTPLPNLIYYVPCGNSPFNGTDQCVNRTQACPSYLGIDDSCYRLAIDAREADGIFMGTVDPKNMDELGGHAMNVVGYNDDWIYRNRFQAAESSAQLKGGFILHNSWRKGGHSVNYFLGEQSEENEAVICPNHNVSLNWIPATQECVRNHTEQIATTNWTDCAGVSRTRGYGRNNGSDLLFCKNASRCDTSLLYLLGSGGMGGLDVVLLPSGLVDVGVVTFNRTTLEVGYTRISQLPFWALSQIFAPIPETFVDNDADQCGYWMFPYETLENIQRVNWDLFDNFRVIDLEVEFAPRSYIRHPDSKAYNTTLLALSTRKVNHTEFDGPLPFQYVY